MHQVSHMERRSVQHRVLGGHELVTDFIFSHEGADCCLGQVSQIFPSCLLRTTPVGDCQGASIVTSHLKISSKDEEH